MQGGDQFISMIRHNQRTAGIARQRHRGIWALLHSLGLLPRLGRGIRPGDGIVVVGYPLQGLLASEANVTTRTVSALVGPGDNRRFIQITAPVQSGNSCGPLFAHRRLDRLTTQLDEFKEYADPQSFYVNPMSKLCRDRFFPAWGTDFCKEHGK